MNANEMCDETLLEIDKLLSYSAPSFLDSEMSIVLSQSAEEYIKTKYNYKGNRYRDGFEGSEKRRNDLAQLIKSASIQYNSTTSTYTISTQGGNTDVINDINDFFSDSFIIKPNGSLWKLPKDLLWVINEEVDWNTTDECYSDVRTSVKPITHDEYNQWKNNTFKKPYIGGDEDGLVWRLDYASEYNYNEINDTVPGNINTNWYRVLVPSTVDSPASYELVVNGSTYSSTSITQAAVISDLITAMEGTETYRLSSDGLILYVLSSQEVTTNSGSTTNNIIIQLSYIPLPDQRTYNYSIVGTDYGTNQLITDGTYPIENYYVTYIRRPRDIVVDFNNPINQVNCELDEFTHREIILIAARKLYSRLQDPRIRSHVLEESKAE